MNIETVWEGIRAHVGETFHTKTGLPFTDEVVSLLIAWFGSERVVAAGQVLS